MDGTQYYDYLKSTSNVNGANWIMRFNEKACLMESMYKSARMNGEDFERGFGNYNSNIIFVFNDMDDYKKQYNSIMELIKPYTNKVYEIFVSFKSNENVLNNEIDIIKPKVVYFFCKNLNFDNMKSMKFNDIKSIYVSDCMDRKYDKTYIFDRFKYLITYQDSIALV